MKHKIALVVFGLVCFVHTDPVAKVEEQIWKNLDESELTNVLITFRKSDIRSAWDRFYDLKLTSRETILKSQHAILKDHADVVQGRVVTMLKEALFEGKIHYLDQLWISNELIVRDVDKEIVQKLRNHPDVESLVAEQFIPLDDFPEEERYDISDFNNTIQNQWNIVNIEAPTVWARGSTGTDIVIALVDSGVRFTHELLATTYRGNDPGENHNYNWRAPTGNYPIPLDETGHGSHVIGIAAGAQGFGVAPNARWIACRGCAGAGTSCSIFDLFSCGNWIACPTDTAGEEAQCDRAPHVVNNSWGGGGGNSFYQEVITAWRNAGIVPVFSAGNSGTECGTLGSPGDQPGVISVASTTNNNELSTFSSVGPGPNGSQKPSVAAPGSGVASASHLTDTGLLVASGTSMAAPHVTGTVALILSARPHLTIDQVESAITGGAISHVSQGRVCGGRSESQRPNFHTGYGQLNAENSA